MYALNFIFVSLLIVSIAFGAKVALTGIAIAAASLLAVAILPAEAAQPSEIRLSFRPEGEWSFQGTGRYQGWADQRDLFVIYHPWEESHPGQSGSVIKEVFIPADWEGRVRLYFYMTDDYHGQHPKLDSGNWLGQMSLVGHRFKQLLIDDEVIWEVDVADPEGVSVPSRFSVLLPERVKAGDLVQVEFRLIDKLGSMEHLDEDYRHIGTTDGIQESDPWRFMTHIYVGDVTLTPESTHEMDAGESPNSLKTRKLHNERWPLEEYGQEVDFPVSLTWEGYDEASTITSAIRCGVPLPPGRAYDTRQIVLSDRAGKPLPTRISPMNQWSDGSLRWVELDAIVSRDDPDSEGKLMLDIGDGELQTPLPEYPVSVVSGNGNTFIISSGLMQVNVGGNDGTLLAQVACGNTTISDLAGEIEIDEQIYRTIIDTARMLAPGPIRGEVELSGKMRSTDNEIGRFVFRVSAMAGQPYIRMTWRIFNDWAETLKVSRFELVGRYPTRDGDILRWGKDKEMAGADVCIQQLTEDGFEVIDGSGSTIGAGESSQGWLGVANDRHSMVILVRHFRQQFPKALELRQGNVRIALFQASPEQPHYLPTPGEAKRHEIWLGLWDQPLSAEEMEHAARFFSRPGRLFDAQYFCDSGAFGYAAPHNSQQFADLDSYMKEAYGDIDEKRFYQLGIRNWGDQPYQRDKNSWCNGYYDRQQGLASEYLMTGDPRWFDRLEATVRHIMDIDICHSSENPNLIGSIYACYAVNHTDGSPWDMMQRTKGMLAYWRLTGDVDAKLTALEVADSAIRANRGMGRTSVRDHGGVLYCLMAAYDETSDPKYLEAGQRVAHDAMSRIDPRRGCYSEVHGNISYRGNVPWMVAQLAQPLYEYYRYSGDVDAAVAVVGLAESILMENCERGILGDVYGYSHNPHFKKTSGYHVLIAPAIMYAYELTGNDMFLKHGRAMYAQTIREKSVNAINNCYWNTPSLLYYLKSSEVVER